MGLWCHENGMLQVLLMWLSEKLLEEFIELLLSSELNVVNLFSFPIKQYAFATRCEESFISETEHVLTNPILSSDKSFEKNHSTTRTYHVLTTHVSRRRWRTFGPKILD